MRTFDIVRIFVIFEGIISAIFSIISLKYFISRCSAKELILHIARITAVYDMVVLYECVDVFTHIDKSARWQTFALLVVFSLATSAQVPLVGLEWYFRKMLRASNDSG